MPKNGPSAEEWKERLRAFANGEFQFRKGQMQAKGNHWGCHAKIGPAGLAVLSGTTLCLRVLACVDSSLQRH